MLKFIKTFLTLRGCIFTLSDMNKPKTVPLLLNFSVLSVAFSTVNFITLFVSIAQK